MQLYRVEELGWQFTLMTIAGFVATKMYLIK